MVRHRLVREIILAYEKLDEENRQRKLADDARKLAGPAAPALENMATEPIEDKKESQ